MSAATTTSGPEQIIADIINPETRGNLYPHYHALREAAPIHKTHNPILHEAWVFTRHADADQLLRNPKAISDRRTTEMYNVGAGGTEYYDMMKRMLLWLDPPDHQRIRSMVARVFTPRAVEKIKPAIGDVVTGLLDAVADDGQMDVVSQFAYPLPVHVICEMLGIPRSDIPDIEQWMWDFARRGDIAALSDEMIVNGEKAVRGFTEYFTALAAERRANPGDDLMTKLVTVEDERGPLTDHEIVPTCIILLQAGHETTADIIGNATKALLENPSELERLQADPELIDDGFEELLRYDSSVQINHRVLAADVEVAGQTFPEGDLCVVMLGACNRDPEAFPEPDRLDLTRDASQHNGFGLGAYYCLGSSLARAEAIAALDALVQRFPTLELDTDKPAPVYRPTLVLHGHEHLHVRWN